MNPSQLRAIRGLLIVLGYLTSNSVHLYGKVRTTVLQFVAAVAVAIHKATQTLLNGAFRASRFLHVPSFSLRTASSATIGIDLIIEIIFLTLALYVEAFTLPGALTAIATTALTSVNSGVITLFQVVIPLSAVIVTILLIIGVIRRALNK